MGLRRAVERIPLSCGDARQDRTIIIVPHLLCNWLRIDDSRALTTSNLSALSLILRRICLALQET
jgi:hypothetical protein